MDEVNKLYADAEEYAKAFYEATKDMSDEERVKFGLELEEFIK